ncbi:TPA: hypothetical protein ACIITR_004620, partial [Salmonella enterica]
LQCVPLMAAGQCGSDTRECNMYGTVLPITWRMLCDQHGMRISLKIKIFIRDRGPGVIDLATHPSQQGLTCSACAPQNYGGDLSPPAGVNLWRHLAEIYSEK